MTGVCTADTDGVDEVDDGVEFDFVRMCRTNVVVEDGCEGGWEDGTSETSPIDFSSGLVGCNGMMGTSTPAGLASKPSSITPRSSSSSRSSSFSESSSALVLPFVALAVVSLSLALAFD